MHSSNTDVVSPAGPSAEGCLLRFRRGLVASQACCCFCAMSVSGGLSMHDAGGCSPADSGDTGIMTLQSTLLPLLKKRW